MDIATNIKPAQKAAVNDKKPTEPAENLDVDADLEAALERLARLGAEEKEVRSRIMDRAETKPEPQTAEKAEAVAPEEVRAEAESKVAETQNAEKTTEVMPERDTELEVSLETALKQIENLNAVKKNAKPTVTDEDEKAQEEEAGKTFDEKLTALAKKVDEATTDKERADRVEDIVKLFMDIADQRKSNKDIDAAVTAYGIAKDWHAGAVGFYKIGGFYDTAASTLLKMAKRYTEVASNLHDEERFGAAEVVYWMAIDCYTDLNHMYWDIGRQDKAHEINTQLNSVVMMVARTAAQKKAEETAAN
jgi:vacuolar-type H+-ATPase subunit I/STV1